jgi:hypothetical protein
LTWDDNRPQPEEPHLARRARLSGSDPEPS